MENIPGFTLEFNKIARRHGFTTANNTGNRVKDLITKARTPLGDKNTEIVYRIPCQCKKFSYTGDTHRMWGSRKKEHQDKVRLTKEDIRNGNTERANKRMNEGDGGLAKHASTCLHDIDWDNARIVGKEAKWTQRKYLEGIETLRGKNRGITPFMLSTD